ncbi:MAG TPA: hypothetical protein DFR83_24510 [Deltaproteobacteria bacterium]|nr:hypothetical protein [Deltaproteobacteria bacterium]
MRLSTVLLLGLPLLVACEDVKEDEGEDGHDHNHGLITALELNFTDSSGSTSTFSFSDPTGDGSNTTTDDIVLTAGESYDVSMRVLNQLEEPVEDVTIEIDELAEEHQFFFTGTAVFGPASASQSAVVEHTYNDEDANGLPLGLDNVFVASTAGEDTMWVTLRHMPPESSQDVKVEGLAEALSASGGDFSVIGGSNDIQKEFLVTVN